MSPNNPSSSPQSLIQGIPSSICFVSSFENKAYRGNQWRVRSRKLRKNGGRCSLPSSFAFFARREPRQNSAGNMTSFLTMEFTVVLAVERRFTNPPPNLTLAVDGLLSTKVSLQPLIDPPTPTGGGLRSRAQLVGAIWVTFSRARATRLRLTNAIASTASQSSFFLLISLLVYHLSPSVELIRR